MNQPACPDCDIPMETGFIPDLTNPSLRSRGILQTLWHPGVPEHGTILGIRTGTLSVEESDARVVVTFRCPACGLLRSYAE